MKVKIEIWDDNGHKITEHIATSDFFSVGFPTPIYLGEEEIMDGFKVEIKTRKLSKEK